MVYIEDSRDWSFTFHEPRILFFPMGMRDLVVKGQNETKNRKEKKTHFDYKIRPINRCIQFIAQEKQNRQNLSCDAWSFITTLQRSGPNQNESDCNYRDQWKFFSQSDFRKETILKNNHEYLCGYIYYMRESLSSRYEIIGVY